MFFRRFSGLLLVSMLTPVLFGCGGADGPPLGAVTGKITLDGAVLTNVSITFVPEDPKGSPSYGGTNAQGVYTLLYSKDRRGAILGKHDVSLAPNSPKVNEDGTPVAGQDIPKIPARYLQPGTLKADVKAGSNTIDFALEGANESVDKTPRKK